MVNEYANDAVRGELAESVAVTVKFDVPAAEGVPEIIPVAASRPNPAGRVPAEIDHVYGAVPPVAVSAWLYTTPTVPSGSEAGVILILADGKNKRALSSSPQPANERAVTTKNTHVINVDNFLIMTPFRLCFGNVSRVAL
jgi:hypothetical protein